jgi:hypothetical protein
MACATTYRFHNWENKGINAHGICDTRESIPKLQIECVICWETNANVRKKKVKKKIELQWVAACIICFAWQMSHWLLQEENTRCGCDDKSDDWQQIAVQPQRGERHRYVGENMGIIIDAQSIL